jgi:peptide/nickel transport system permease protein
VLAWSGRADPTATLQLPRLQAAAATTRATADAETDALLNAVARSATRPSARRLYEQIAARVLKERPIIYLYHRNWLWAYNAKLSGVRADPDGCCGSPAEDGSHRDARSADVRLPRSSALATSCRRWCFVVDADLRAAAAAAGDPAKILAARSRTRRHRAPARRAAPRRALPLRYAYWVGGVLQGDLGESVRTQQPVLELVKQKLPVTIELALMAFVIALVIGIPTGIVAAVGAAPGGTAGQCGGAVGHQHAELLARHPDDPAVLGATRLAAGLGLREPVRGPESEPRVDDHAGLRARQRDRRGADAPHAQRDAAGAVVGLRAHRTRQGLNERTVVLKHALRNALTPVITLGALELGTLLSGAVLTEQVFTIPASAS